MTSLIIGSPSGQIEVAASSAASLGRDASSTVQIADERVSRRHGLVRFDRDGWVYEDLASSNGSFVNGARIQSARIETTATIRLGNAADGPMVYLRVLPERSSSAWAVPAAVAGAVVLVAAVAWGSASIFPERGGASSSALPSPSASNSLTRIDIVASGKAGTVLIVQGNGQGSGVYLGNDRILTALHVIATTGPITISVNDRTIGSAQLIATDQKDDLAMLFAPGLDAAGAKPIAWGDSDKLREGDELVVLGYPVGLPFSVKVGVVSGLRTEGSTKLIQTDASLNPGMSGGPALDPSGLLVGITDFGSSRYPGLNFLVGSATARRFADEHR